MSRGCLLVLVGLALMLAALACSPAKATSNPRAQPAGSSSEQLADGVGNQLPTAGGLATVRFLVPTVT